MKILSIHRKNILGKQLSQVTCSKYVFRLLHALKFQILSTKLNMMIKVVVLFTGVLWKSCLMNVIGKHLWRSLFFKNRGVSCDFSKYFRKLFLQNSSGWMLLLNTLLSSLRRPQPQKMFPSTLAILNILETNIAICLRTALCGGSRQTVLCD